MTGRSGKITRDRRLRVVSQKRKAEADPEPEFEVKTEQEEESDGIPVFGERGETASVKTELETRWEWQADGDMWMAFSPLLNSQINLAFSSGKRCVTVSPVAGISLQVDMKRMVQKNKQSGYQRPVRLAVKDEDQFFVWQWQTDDGAWISYDSNTCISLETALQTDAKLLSLSLGDRAYTIDLADMVQKNSQTHNERQIQRCLSAADSSGSQQKQNISNGPKGVKRARGSRNSGTVENESEENKEQVRTLVLKGKSPVDPECSSKLGKAHVFCEGDDVYDVMLNQGETTRHFPQNSLGEEIQQQQVCEQPLQQYHPWYQMPDLSSHHDPQVQISGLPPHELLDDATCNIIEDSPDFTGGMSLIAGREADNTEIQMAYPQRKSTVWDFFHLKDPSIGIRNATSAFCNLCTREVKRGSTPGRLGTTAMRNHLAKHHQREWAASSTGNVMATPSVRNTSRHQYAVASTSKAHPHENGQPLLRSVLDICYCFFATVCTLCGAVVSRGETVAANREYLMLQHMQSAHCSILRVSLSEMKGGGFVDDDSSNSSS